LAEANEMMKVMSGYDTSKKPDYKQQVSAELERIESKVILLNDMLNNKTVAEIKAKSDSTILELLSTTKVAQTRLQKLIDDNDDEDRMVRLLEMNGYLEFI
jgi:DNA integrity scanning protein DisA with diadenylate cyclase activity